MPEAKLAREAVIGGLLANADKARGLVRAWRPGSVTRLGFAPKAATLPATMLSSPRPSRAILPYSHNSTRSPGVHSARNVHTDNPDRYFPAHPMSLRISREASSLSAAPC